MSDVDDKFDDGPKFARPGELTDLALLPGEFRAFRLEMRESVEGIVRALQTLGRIEKRIDAVIDRQNHIEGVISDLERRVSNLEQRPTRRTRKVKK